MSDQATRVVNIGSARAGLTAAIDLDAAFFFIERGDGERLWIHRFQLLIESPSTLILASARVL